MVVLVETIYVSDQNEQQEYDHKGNLRVCNMKEKGRETTDECAKKCCLIFTDLISVPTTVNREVQDCSLKSRCQYGCARVCFQDKAFTVHKF